MGVVVARFKIIEHEYFLGADRQDSLCNCMDEKIHPIADLVRRSRRLVVFTGAGVSTESGIPDFRSPGGIWQKYYPEAFYYQLFFRSEPARAKYWQMRREFYALLKGAQPNPAHRAIAELERMGKLDCLITQNVDHLHQRAGVPPEKVIELHGTALTVSCLNCHNKYPMDEIQSWLLRGVGVPRCDRCGGILKSDTVAFGQPMPPEQTAESFRRARSADLLIVIGSSLVVQPAASIPLEAKESGGRLVIINREPTGHDHHADIVVHGLAGMILARILEDLRRDQ